MTEAEALQIMGLDPESDPTETQVRAAYHGLCRRVHPDSLSLSPDYEAWYRLREAWAVLKTGLPARRQCRQCRGQGAVSLAGPNWSHYLMQCEKCGGSGERTA